MPAKHKSKLRARPQMTNHSGFKKLYHRWVKRTYLNEVDFLRTKHFAPLDFLKSLLLASVDNTSITDAFTYHRVQGLGCPSSELALKCCRSIPPTEMEVHVNWALRQQFQDLPPSLRRIFKKEGLVIIDFHGDPYYGNRENPLVTKGPTKRSTQWSYQYLTAALASPRGMQTIAVRFRYPDEPIAALFWDLFAWIEVIVTPKMILMDGEFAKVRVFEGLLQKGIPFVARKNVTTRLFALKLAYELTDNWLNLRHVHVITFQDHSKRHQATVHVIFHQTKGEMKALAFSPQLQFSPKEAEKLYSRRFSIETGYRDKHVFQARTTSPHLSIRLLLYLIAIVLWNLWQAFLFSVFPHKTTTLSQVNQWRRRIRTVKRFLMRDELL